MFVRKYHTALLMKVRQSYHLPNKNFTDLYWNKWNWGDWNLFIFSSKMGRNEALSLFGFEVPLMLKHPELFPVKKPMQLSSTTWDDSVKINKTRVCFMTEYLLGRDQYLLAVWAAATGLSISSGQELPAEPPSWLQLTQRGFNAQVSSKNRVRLKDVH